LLDTSLSDTDIEDDYEEGSNAKKERRDRNRSRGVSEREGSREKRQSDARGSSLVRDEDESNGSIEVQPLDRFSQSITPLSRSLSRSSR
jgi:hypothetical protein